MPAHLDWLDAGLLATAAEWFGGTGTFDHGVGEWSVRNGQGFVMSVRVEGADFVFRNVSHRYELQGEDYVRSPDPETVLRCVLFRAAFWHRKRHGKCFLALPDEGFDESSGWRLLTKPRQSPAVLEAGAASAAATATFARARDARIFTRYAILPLQELVISLIAPDGRPLFGPGPPGHMVSRLPGRLAGLPPERLAKAVQWAATAEPAFTDGYWGFLDKTGDRTSITAMDDDFVLDFQIPSNNADRKRYYVRTADTDILTRCLLFLCGGADKLLEAADTPMGSLPYSSQYGCRVEDPEQDYPVTIIGTSEEGTFRAFFPTSDGALHLTYYAGAPIDELIASIESEGGAPLFTPDRLGSAA